MKYIEFKTRYLAELTGYGGELPDVDSQEYAVLEEQITAIYIGLKVYVDWQNEEARKQKKPEKKIYVPNNGIIQ